MATRVEITARSKLLRRVTPIVVVGGTAIGIVLSFFPTKYAVALISIMIVVVIVGILVSKRT